jgi:hypothetical protein
MKITRFDPPANVQDLKTDQQRQGWSDLIERYFDESIAAVENAFPGVTCQFYNPRTTDTDSPSAEKLIEWPGFPKILQDRFPDDRRRAWETAEATPGARKKYQDEYLEWNVVRKAGKITRVSFTCEGPEYWDFLAQTDPGTLLELYRGLVDPARKEQVKLSDLVTGGSYNPGNKWNTRYGAVHLTQPNNTLGAEIKIAADATVLWRHTGQPVTDTAQLICCGRFGDGGRASDPKIGADVNTLARAGYSITLRNPVALYITGYSHQGWKKPNGKAVGNYWKVVRGTPAPGTNKPAQVLHLVYEVPPGEGFVVGDITINGRPIEFGGQIAEFVRVGLVGVACRKGKSHNPAQECTDPECG